MKVKDLKKYPNLYNLVILKFYFVRQQPLKVLDEIELNLSNYEKDKKPEEKYFTIKCNNLLNKSFLSKVNSSPEKELADMESYIVELLDTGTVSIVDDCIKGFSSMVGAWKDHLNLSPIKIQDQDTHVDEYYYCRRENKFYFLTLKKDFSLENLFSTKVEDLRSKIEKVYTVFKSGVPPKRVEINLDYKITDIIYPKYADSLIFNKSEAPLGEIKVEAPLLNSVIENIKSNFLSLKIVIKDQKVFIEYEEKSTAIKSINSIGEYKKKITNLLAGKFLNKFSQVKLTSLQIEAEINLIKSQLEPPEIDIVSGYDIAKYYNGFYYSTLQDVGTLKDSCMKYDRCQRYLGIYVRNSNVKLLILRSKIESDKIVGRAILWQNVMYDGDVEDYIDPEKDLTVLDRFYGPTKYEEFIKNYALSMGWICKNRNSAGDYDFLIMDNDNIKRSLYINSKLYVKLEYSDFELYPYMDTFKDLDVLGKTLCACSGGNLDNTNGSGGGNYGDHYASSSYIISKYGDEHPDKTEEELELDILNAFNYGLPLPEQIREYHSNIGLYFSSSEGKLYNNSVTGLCAVNLPTCKEINSTNKIEIKSYE